jgi:hypothetical protein
MRRQKAIVKHLSILIGLALAPLCAPSLAASGSARPEYAALSDLAASATLIDAWRDYALATLRPSFDWASTGAEPLRAPSLFERGRARMLPPASHFNGSVIDSSPLHVAISSTQVSDTPLYVPAGGAALLPNHTAGLQRYVIAPSYSQPLGAVGAVSFSAIFAYQHFAGLGALPGDRVNSDFALTAPPALRTSDTSSGAGLRVDYVAPIGKYVSWQFGMQSRINMDPLDNYRGLYAEPGTFDIPASANLGLGYLVAPQLRLDAGVERIMYSQIAPFTSSALPSRFLALLSSSVSPEFAWQDLNVYSLAASWHGETWGDWSIRYSTREQPLPTSALLANALPPPSARNYELGYARAFGERSSLRFSASYAPTDFILGIPLSYSVSHAGNQMQWEALWVTNF